MRTRFSGVLSGTDEGISDGDNTMGPVLPYVIWGDLTGQSEGERPGCVGDQKQKTRADCESKVRTRSLTLVAAAKNLLFRAAHIESKCPSPRVQSETSVGRVQDITEDDVPVPVDDCPLAAPLRKSLC